MDRARRRFSTRIATLGLAIAALAVAVRAQELPQSDNSFEVEPPSLIPPPASDATDPDESPASVETLQKRLAQSKEDAAEAVRLVRKGVLAKVEAEQRALRVLRVEAALAQAEQTAAEAQVTLQKKLVAAGQGNQLDLDAALATLTQATAAAGSATAAYETAQREAAERDLRRQKKLLSQGSARKSDVARAEEKLATLSPAPTAQPSATP